MTTSGQDPLLDWAAASKTCEGQEDCGDALLVRSFPEGALVAIVDGLGHGREAAVAAQAAIESLERDPAEPVEALLRRCHSALSRTRGAAVSVLSLRDGLLTWAGVGNVEAVLLRAGSSGPSRRVEHLLLGGGIVGQRLPRLRPRSVRVAAGDLLAAASDGVRPGLASQLDCDASPANSVERLLARSGPGDDALVWVGRAGLRVNRGVIRVDRRIEVDLRLGDVQKAPRLSFDAFARLGAGQHVIGRREDLGRAPGGGPQGAKGFDQGQRGSRQ